MALVAASVPYANSKLSFSGNPDPGRKAFDEKVPIE